MKDRWKVTITYTRYADLIADAYKEIDEMRHFVGEPESVKIDYELVEGEEEE